MLIMKMAAVIAFDWEACADAWLTFAQTAQQVH